MQAGYGQKTNISKSKEKSGMIRLDKFYIYIYTNNNNNTKIYLKQKNITFVVYILIKLFTLQ